MTNKNGVDLMGMVRPSDQERFLIGYEPILLTHLSYKKADKSFKS